MLPRLRGSTVHTLLLDAQTALENASGPGAFALFDPVSAARATLARAADAEAEIVAALNEGRSRLALQPIVAARTGEPVMSEAVLRIVRRGRADLRAFDLSCRRRRGRG